jgi:hypothetical protein
MRNRRLAITGLAMIAALGLTGCGPTDAGDAPVAGASTATTTAAPVAADAAAELAAAAVKLGTVESLKVKMAMAGGLSAQGVATGDGSKLDMTMVLGQGSSANKITVRKLGDDMWMKFGGSMGSTLGAAAGKWMHVDAAQLPAGSSLSGGNPKDAAKMIQASTDVTKSGEHSFKGTLDMTKSPAVDKKTVASLGAKAKAVPFTAETDAEGRLVELSLDMAALATGAGKMVTTYSDFGTPIAVKAPPAAQVTEMPKQLLGVVKA